MSRRVTAMMWAGVGLAPIAWMVEHGAGFSLAEANCSVVGEQWGVGFTTWIIAVTAATGALAALGIAAAFGAYRAVRDAGNDDDPPPGRIWLMAIFGMIVSPILLVMIVMSGLGALLLEGCTQV